MQEIKIHNQVNIDFDNIPIYWINLDHHTNRRKFMELQLNNKNHTRISGVNGKTLDEYEINKYINNSKKNFFEDEKMSKGEIGCLLSHIKVFKESIFKNDEYIIVMEDDANILNFSNVDIKKFLLDNYYYSDCIQLCIILPEHVSLPNEKPILLNWNDYNNYHHPMGFTWSTACYIISRNARIKIIEKFENAELLRPADYFIYKNTNTKTLFPPLVSYNLYFDSFIQNDSLECHIKSFYRIRDYYFNNKLILIAIWFGDLPDYFDLWLYTVKNMNYDILFVTDQKITYLPNNFKYLNITIEQFNDHLNNSTGFNVTIKNLDKLVDVKPLFGYLFSEFINCYEYWGWTDIDMLMGDVTKVLYTEPNYDIYSNGFPSFGPLMIFKRELIDIYKHIENYEDILNDSYICKVDEPWWFLYSSSTSHLSIYTDQKTKVKYYSGKNILDYVSSKKTHVLQWNNICTGIDWNISSNLIKNTGERWNYYITDNMLLKDGMEINHSHLTLLKNNKSFNNFIRENVLISKKPIFFSIILTYNYNNENLDNLNVYDIYDKFVNISFSIW